MQDAAGLRLLMITERYPPDIGGVSASAGRMSQLAAELGAETHVLALTKLRPPGLLDSQPTESHSGNSPVMVHRLGRYAQWDATLQHAVGVIQWLHEQHPFHVVWGHYLYPAGFLAVYLGESFGIASIAADRGNDIDRLMFPPGDFSRLLWTLQRATRVTAVSDELRRKITVLLGGSNE